MLSRGRRPIGSRVARAYSALPSDPERSVRRWAARLGVSVSVAGVGVSMAPRPPRPPADEARVALLELLDVPRALHEADGELTVICLDEFQDLLPPLPVAEAARDIEALLRADDLDPAGAVDELLAFTGGHPQRTILLAHHLYNLLDRPDRPDDPASAAIELALEETRDVHQALWDSLDRNERLVLLAVGDGQAPTGTVVASEHRVARSTLQEALDRLLADRRHVQRGADGKPYLLDPLFAEWLRRR